MFSPKIGKIVLFRVLTSPPTCSSGGNLVPSTKVFKRKTLVYSYLQIFYTHPTMVLHGIPPINLLLRKAKVTNLFYLFMIIYSTHYDQYSSQYHTYISKYRLLKKGGVVETATLWLSLCCIGRKFR